MPQADQVRGKLREFIARRRQPGTDEIAVGNESAACYQLDRMI